MAASCVLKGWPRVYLYPHPLGRNCACCFGHSGKAFLHDDVEARHVRRRRTGGRGSHLAAHASEARGALVPVDPSTMRAHCTAHCTCTALRALCMHTARTPHVHCMRTACALHACTLHVHCQATVEHLASSAAVSPGQPDGLTGSASSAASGSDHHPTGSEVQLVGEGKAGGVEGKARSVPQRRPCSVGWRGATVLCTGLSLSLSLSLSLTLTLTLTLILILTLTLTLTLALTLTLNPNPDPTRARFGPGPGAVHGTEPKPKPDPDPDPSPTPDPGPEQVLCTRALRDAEWDRLTAEYRDTHASSCRLGVRVTVRVRVRVGIGARARARARARVGVSTARRTPRRAG